MSRPSATLERLRPHILMDRLPLVVDLERSQGSTLWDGAEDVGYLDFFTGFASLPLGWNHPGLKTADFQRRLLRAATDKPALSDLYLPEVADFVETFYRVALPPELPYIFTISGGALAVENALKTAFDWRCQRNRMLGLEVTADQVLSFERAFHGRSGYTMSITDSFDPRKTADFPGFDWPRVEAPWIRHPRTPENDAETAASEARSLERVASLLDERAGRIAAIIIEPIQGEGGDRHFRPSFLQALRRLADVHDVLLIFDEVQSGMGATGQWWAHQAMGVQPDLLVFGKKAQVCGFAASRRLECVPRHVFAESSRINSTRGGNLVDMVRCTRVLEVIEEEGLLANARRIGEILRVGLARLEASNPAVTAVRGRACMLAFDLPDKAWRDALVTAALSERLLGLGCGARSLRLRPHLATTPEEAEEALLRLERALGRVASGHAEP